MFNKKAQSTLEYVIILTGIVAAVLFALNTLGVFKKDDSATGLGKLMNQAAESIKGASEQVADIIQ